MGSKTYKLDVYAIEWNVFGCRYISKGHHDQEAFIKALNEYDDFQGRYSVAQVKHGLMHCWPDRAGDYDLCYRDESQPGPGVFPVTYVESE